jgi:hypothetical protein
MSGHRRAWRTSFVIHSHFAPPLSKIVPRYYVFDHFIYQIKRKNALDSAPKLVSV